MKSQEELEEEHAVRVRIWVTSVIAFTFIAAIFFPDYAHWLGFGSNLFWIWRK